jgi:hypothetical protein
VVKSLAWRPFHQNLDPLIGIDIALTGFAETVGLNRNQVGAWRHRWKDAFYDLVAVECSEGIPALKQAITKLLSDAPRSGRPNQLQANS